MRKVLIASLLACAQLCALLSCGIVDNPQSSGDGPNIPPSTDTGVAITLNDFDAYLGKRVDIRLVGGDGTVLVVARYAQLKAEDTRLEILSVPQKPGSYVDVLIDADGDGEFELASEPAWSEPLTAGSVAFSGTQPPTGAPEPEKAGGDFKMSFTGFAALDGKLLRLAMLNPAGQVTGLYDGIVQGGNFTVELPQVVVNTQPYTFAIYADANGNGHYDAPPADAAWYAYATGEPTGITYVFAYNEDFEDVDFEQ